MGSARAPIPGGFTESTCNVSDLARLPRRREKVLEDLGQKQDLESKHYRGVPGFRSFAGRKAVQTFLELDETRCQVEELHRIDADLEMHTITD